MILQCILFSFLQYGESLSEFSPPHLELQGTDFVLEILRKKVSLVFRKH